jgi:CubicO group peptidase (beta-lactamase class C family)
MAPMPPVALRGIPCIRAIAVLLAAGPGPPALARDFSVAAELLAKAVEEGAFPGCVAASGSSRELFWIAGFGRLDEAGGPPATAATLYDLASLTKVVGTTSVILALTRDGKLSPGDKVAKHLPEFAGAPPASGAGRPADAAWREQVTIEHLLTHSSGLPAWRPFHREVRSYGELLARVLAEPLEVEPGTRERYSDLGFILLGEIAARAGGRPLEELERTLVFEPLGLAETLRSPPPELLARIAPTERAPGGEGFIHGIVHDENSRAAEGRTGHAGLFSTARDLAAFAAELLRCQRGEGVLFPRELAVEFTRRRGLVEGSSRALGWDTPSRSSSAGEILSPRSFGHTGFTGTSLWIDPERDLYVILLSNRVHPSRDSRGILEVRPRLADAVARAAGAGRRQRL